MDIFNQNWQQRIKNDELTRTYLTGDGKEYIEVKTVKKLREDAADMNDMQRNRYVYDKREWERMVRNDNNLRKLRQGLLIEDMEVGTKYYHPSKLQETKIENRSSYSRVNSLYNLHYASLR